MGARVGPNTSLVQIGCKILRAISNDIKECERFDVKSTEEILHKFDKYNEKYKMNDFQNKVVLSMDIKKFYPSIVPEKAADIARIMFERSKVEVDNLNVDELALYLSMNFSRNELNKENLLEVTYTKLNKSTRFSNFRYSTLFTMPYLIVAHYHETNTVTISSLNIDNEFGNKLKKVKC